MSKGSKPRSYDKEAFDKNYDAIFKTTKEEVLDSEAEVACALRGDTIVESADGKWAIRIAKGE